VHEFGDREGKVIPLDFTFRDDLAVAYWLQSTFWKKNVHANERSPSLPFITGDAFRAMAKHKWDTCGGTSYIPQNGDIVYVKSDCFPWFMRNIASIVTTTVTYSIITHNSDISVPKGIDIDGDVRIRALFAQNCEWSSPAKPRKLHCIPIGIENRYNHIGRDPSVYWKALTLPVASRRLLLTEMYQQTYGDRKELMRISPSWKWATILRPVRISHWWQWATIRPGLSHALWLQHVRTHRFVTCPHGNGIDTHRLWEVLMMGSTCIIRSSTLDSMLEGLDVMIVDQWSDVTHASLSKFSSGNSRSPKVFMDWWQRYIYRIHHMSN